MVSRWPHCRWCAAQAVQTQLMHEAVSNCQFGEVQRPFCVVHVRLLPRLPKVDSLSLRVEGTLRSLPLSLVLHILRIQMAGSMRSLSLDLHQSWKGAAHAWMELGHFTGLSKLKINCAKQVRAGRSGHVASLFAMVQVRMMYVPHRAALLCQGPSTHRAKLS